MSVLSHQSFRSQNLEVFFLDFGPQGDWFIICANGGRVVTVRLILNYTIFEVLRFHNSFYYQRSTAERCLLICLSSFGDWGFFIFFKISFLPDIETRDFVKIHKFFFRQIKTGRFTCWYVARSLNYHSGVIFFFFHFRNI